MRRLLILIMAVATIMTVVVGLATAAPPDKTDVCHYDADSGTFHLINISENAVDRHIDHGDGLPGEPVPRVEGYTFDDKCVPVADEVPEVLFAVAYTDIVDDGGTYDPAVDVLVAKVIDGSGAAADGLLGVGDLVVTNQYPLLLTGPFTFGSYGDTSHTITQILAVGPLSIVAADADRALYFIGHEPGQDEWYSEVSGVGPLSGSRMDDFLGDVGRDDRIVANPPGPSGASVALDVTVARASDDAFFDVEITLP